MALVLCDFCFASEDTGLDEDVSAFRIVFTQFVFDPRSNTSPPASGSVPGPQTACTTAGVQVEHTEAVKKKNKHYKTLNGYCDHHKLMPHH